MSDTIGTTYRPECEHVTGTGPAPWSGEEVAYADCPEPAFRQADGTYKCVEHGGGEECGGECITRPHRWSPSGARCTREGCDVVGTGDPCGDGNCEGRD